MEQFFMMQAEHIQSKIGYVFKNPKLLYQAFTRKSYAEEDKSAKDNEVLEFLGDKVLDFIIVKKMSEYYGSIKGGFFVSPKDEGRLTEIKKKLVCSEMLASKIRELGLQEHLIASVGDELKKIRQQESVQEDLFESILGAVAIDSAWDVETLVRLVDRMLSPGFYFENGFDDEKDYVAIVQQWCQKKYGQLPAYSFFSCVKDFHLFSEGDEGSQQCDLLIPPANIFKALGQNKSQAKINAARKAYFHLERNHLLISLKDEIGEPDFDRAINQLQELYQKKYISEPQYDFSEAHDENGNPVWECCCHVASLGQGFVVSNSSKKQAKKRAAYQMAWLYLGEESDENAAE